MVVLVGTAFVLAVANVAIHLISHDYGLGLWLNMLIVGIMFFLMLSTRRPA